MWQICFLCVCPVYQQLCLGSLSAVTEGFNFGRADQYKYFYFSVVDLNAQYFAYNFCSSDLWIRVFTVDWRMSEGMVYWSVAFG